MIVIANTSPTNYLILIGEIDVLEVLFDHVLIPSAVHAELRHPRTPHDVRSWIARPPAWLEIRTPSRTADARLARLDAGEREAILLTEEFGADQIIIDETLARKEARRRQIPLTGTESPSPNQIPHLPEYSRPARSRPRGVSKETKLPKMGCKARLDPGWEYALNPVVATHGDTQVARVGVLPGR